MSKYLSIYSKKTEYYSIYTIWSIEMMNKSQWWYYRFLSIT
jgi:hypothetical protein